MLTKAEWMAKHANSAKFQALPRAEKERRYQQYLQTGPNPLYASNNQRMSTIVSTASARQGSYSVPRNAPRPKMGSLVSGRSGSVRSAVERSLGAKTLTPQGHDYLTARFNPFCPHLTNVGYPDPAPGGSRKVRGFSEVTVQCNAAGLGFIVASSSACAADNLQGIMYSNSAYIGSPGFPSATGATGTVLTNLGGIPLGAADDVSASLMFRKLGFGIRMRSETALLNKSGIATSVDFPGQGDLLNPSLSDSDYRSLWPYWTMGYPLNEGQSPWMSAIWSPKKPADSFLSLIQKDPPPVGGNPPLAWDSQNAVWGPIANTAGWIDYRWDVGICIVGAPNATFQAQVVGYYEYIGQQVEPQMISSLTPTYSDKTAEHVGEAATNLEAVNVKPKTGDGGLTLSSVTSTLSKVAGGIGNAYSTLKGYLPSPQPQAPTMTIEDVSDSQQSLGGYLNDLESPLIEEIADDAGPLLLTM